MTRFPACLALLAASFLSSGAAGADPAVAEAPPLAAPPGIMDILDRNAALDRHGFSFAVTNRGRGEIELALVKGNWRVREELSAGQLSLEDLNVDFMAALDEEKPYAEARAALKKVVDEISAVRGVGRVIVSGRVDTEDDKRAWGEFSAGLKRYEDGEFASAIPYFERASALGLPRALRTLGYVHENGQGVESDREEGRRWYTKAAEQGEAEAFYNLGRMASGDAKFDEALAYYQMAIKRKPDLAMAYNNIGYLLNELRHHEKAIPFLRRAIELNPEYPGSYSNLGISLDNLGKHGEATGVYREALALSPNSADVRVNLGVTLMRQERLGEAIAEFRKAIHLEPLWHQPYSGLGSIYFARGEFDLAVTAYERLVKNRPDHPWGFKLLAETYARKGEFEKASKAAATALELAKTTPNYDVETMKRIEQEYREYTAARTVSKG